MRAIATFAILMVVTPPMLTPSCESVLVAVLSDSEAQPRKMNGYKRQPR